jgi:hypothetical protein
MWSPTGSGKVQGGEGTIGGLWVKRDYRMLMEEHEKSVSWLNGPCFDVMGTLRNIETPS